MPINAAQLIVEIAADVSKLAKGTGQASGMLGTFAKKATIAGVGLTAAITGPAILAGKAMLDVAMGAEQSRIAFTTMLGSGQKAEKFLEELADFAASTPFEFTELQDASKRMLAFGFASENILPMLRDIGDAAAGLGVGAEGVNRVTLALGQMQAKSKVSAQEMMQLTEAGIPAWRYLAESMGLTTAEVMKLSEKGLLPADEAIQAILAGMRQDFGGMMAAQAETAGGKLSNLKDEVGFLAREIGETMLPAAKEFIDWGRETVEVFGDLGPEAQATWIKIGLGAALIGPATTALGGLAAVAMKLPAVFTAASTAIQGLTLGLGLTGSLSVAGISATAIAVGSVAIAAVAAGAALYKMWQLSQQVAAGGKEVKAGWQGFFDEQVQSGRSAATVLSEYVKKQEMVNSALSGWGALARLAPGFQEAQIRGVEELSVALGRTSTSYDSYLRMFREGLEATGLNVTATGEYIVTTSGARIATDLLTEAEWRAISGADGMNISNMALINQMPQLAEAAAAGAESLSEMGVSAEEAAAAQAKIYDEIVSGAEKTKSGLGEMITQYDTLKGKMDAWLNETAGQVVSMLGDKFSEASGKYRAALVEVDTILGTNYTAQLLQKDAVKGVVDEYAKTGNLEAFKEGLKKIKEEGLADMVQQLEDVTLKAGFLYDKLLALPTDIKIKISFDAEEMPTWVQEAGGSSGGSTPPWEQGGTEEDWASGVTNFVVPAGYPNDSFRVGLTSGEHVTVTPDSTTGGITIGEVNLYSSATNADELFREFLNRLDAEVRDRRSAGVSYAGVSA